MRRAVKPAYRTIAVIATIMLASAALTSPLYTRGSTTSARSFEVRGGPSNLKPCPDNDAKDERGNPHGGHNDRPDPNFRSRDRDSTSATFTRPAPTAADTLIQITPSPTASSSLHNNQFLPGSGRGIASASLSLTTLIPVTVSFPNPASAAQFAQISYGSEVTVPVVKTKSITSTMGAITSSMSQRAGPLPASFKAFLNSTFERASWSVPPQPPQEVVNPTSIPIPFPATLATAVTSLPAAGVATAESPSSISVTIQLSIPPIVQVQAAPSAQQSQPTSQSIIAGPPLQPPSSAPPPSSAASQPTMVALPPPPPSSNLKFSSSSTSALIPAAAQLPPPQAAPATLITATSTTITPILEASTSASLSLLATPTSTDVVASSSSNNTARIAVATTIAAVVAFSLIIAGFVILRRRILLRRHHKRLESRTTTESDSVDIAMDDTPSRSRPLLVGASSPSKKSAGTWGVVEGYADPWRVSLYRRNDDGSGAAPGTVL